MTILFDNSEIYMYNMVLEKKNSSNHIVLIQVLHGGKETMLFLLLLSDTGLLLQYFVSHHFTECSKGDPRAHHEEVEVLCAPNGLRFLNSV